MRPYNRWKRFAARSRRWPRPPRHSPNGRARRQQAHNAKAAARASTLHASTSSTLLAARERCSALAFAIGRASIVITSRQGSHQPAGLALQYLPCRSLSEKFAPTAMATACNCRSPRSRLAGALDLQPVTDSACPVCGSAPITSSVGWVGPRRTIPSCAPAPCAPRCGMSCVSNACCAAPPTASPTR